MRKRREKASIKAAAILLGAALLTGGCSSYQSSEELRKSAQTALQMGTKKVPMKQLTTK